jgi:hypothetical protein
MAFGLTMRSSVASLLYLAVAIADFADNDATSPITNIYISLHEADPTSGNQTTSEGNYGSYARQAVARSASGWTDAAGVVTNDAEILFPTAASGTDTITHVGTGSVVSSTGVIIVAGATNITLNVAVGIAPRFAISALTITVA